MHAHGSVTHASCSPQAASVLGSALYNRCSRWLVLVEGVRDGRAGEPGMQGIGANPLTLWATDGQMALDKVVYSPHLFGPPVAQLKAFTAPTFPRNMPALWDAQFGNLARGRQRLPMVIGAWGGRWANGDCRGSRVAARLGDLPLAARILELLLGAGPRRSRHRWAPLVLASLGQPTVSPPRPPPGAARRGPAQASDALLASFYACPDACGALVGRRGARVAEPPAALADAAPPSPFRTATAIEASPEPLRASPIPVATAATATATSSTACAYWWCASVGASSAWFLPWRRN